MSKHFTVPLALADIVPVVLFAATTAIITVDTQNAVFGAGAAFSVLACVFKILWKFSMALNKKDFRTLNKLFVPLQLIGFLLMMIGILTMFVSGTVTLPWVRDNFISVPAIVFLCFGIVGLCLMGVVRNQYSKEEFDTDAAPNWIAEGVNIFAQASFLMGILFVRLHAGL